MTRLIGVDVYSFSMEDGFNNIKRDYVEDLDTKIKHFIYKSSIYISLDKIKIAYDTGKAYYTLEKGVHVDQIQISKIIFSDGSSVLTPSNELDRIILLSNRDVI
ncbi:hypothetical protein ABEV34_09625 [Methylorubrum rhodesianum]|uniref:ABC transporter related protein n=1 Tax=Methylorubrum populi TaxID=223967 RepID=A0A160PPJ2_9HYPH|nr:hypothetical protein [Methylorubrum extorquens]BAU94100.1 ABC transporter related protein [Methylorubrum populi]